MAEFEPNLVRIYYLFKAYHIFSSAVATCLYYHTKGVLGCEKFYLCVSSLTLLMLPKEEKEELSNA